MDKSHAIVQSWDENAAAWVQALEEEAIKSRKLVTNQAIIDAILSCEPKQVLDLGCGEGWLCRKLQTKAVQTLGIDGAKELISAAQTKDPEGQYLSLNYEELLQQEQILPSSLDLVVLNFALFDQVHSRSILQYLSQQLPKTQLVIQTLHPHFGNQDKTYISGWRQEYWAGLGQRFKGSYRWYYRTLSDWMQLLRDTSWQVFAIREPIHPETEQPASIIFLASNAE